MDFELTDEQKIWRETVIKFSREELNHNISDYERRGEFPWEGWRKCAEQRITGLPFAEIYGGSGADFLTTVLTLHDLAYACKDAGLVHALATQILCGIQIQTFGSESLKNTYLPALCSGKKVFAQAITEPGSGSDALSMRTRAEKQDGVFILNGSKTFISNGPMADVVIVFAVTDPERKTLGGISCLVVEDGTVGFEKGKPLEKMGLSTLQNGELFFDNCRISPDQVLGKVGQGAIIFNESMECERSLLPATHLGTMQRIMEISIQYVKQRSAFGQQISKYQSVANKISQMKVNIELAKGILYRCACAKDRRKRVPVESSICKLFISESLKQACLDAVQIHGGYGYMREYEIERDLRDSIAATIYSGTSEIQYNIIAQLMGL